jgi:hypothetical protein
MPPRRTGRRDMSKTLAHHPSFWKGWWWYVSPWLCAWTAAMAGTAPLDMPTQRRRIIETSAIGGGRQVISFIMKTRIGPSLVPVAWCCRADAPPTNDPV